MSSTVELRHTALEDVFILEPGIFEDARGSFFESWNARVFRELTGLEVAFVQDNHSRSVQGVLRGLHYQLPPNPQGKLVRVVAGAVFDVAVDMRQSSPSFGQWAGTELTAENRKQLWVPPGFAHGFLATSAWADVLYKTTDYFEPELDRSVKWDDPKIGIQWPIRDQPILSDKDATAPGLFDADLFS